MASNVLYDTLSQIRQEETAFGEVCIRDVRLELSLDLLQVYKGDEVELSYQTIEFTPNFVAKKSISVLKKILIDSQVLERPVLTFRGEGHFYGPDLRSNLVVTCRVRTPPAFTWRGTDLFLRKEIDLKTALLCRVVEVTNINGKVCKVTLEEVISPNTVVKIAEEGFSLPSARPANSRSVVPRGDLYVTFDIKFPEFLSLENRDTLIGILKK